MAALYEFSGNGTGGSVALRIYPTFIEYEHRNYLVVLPLRHVTSVSYSKDDNPVYASVKIGGDVQFGCDNKVEVYHAVKDVLRRYAT